MMKHRVIAYGFAVGLLLALACSASAQGADKSALASLEQRANEAFAQGDYVKALPLLVRLSDQYKNDPKKLGPIQEKIRVCQRALSDNPPPDLQAELDGQPMADSNPLTRKRHVRPAAGQTLEVTLRELGNFNYDGDVGGNIPEDVQKLDGATIRTRGYMIPFDQADNITEFALVPSLFACCFGQPPAIHHMMTVKTPQGKALSYFPDEIIVEGKLQVKEEKDEDLIISVFRLECMSVKPSGR